jgi:hypothetical protein
MPVQTRRWRRRTAATAGAGIDDGDELAVREVLLCRSSVSRLPVQTQNPCRWRELKSPSARDGLILLFEIQLNLQLAVAILSGFFILPVVIVIVIMSSFTIIAPFCSIRTTSSLYPLPPSHFTSISNQPSALCTRTRRKSQQLTAIQFSSSVFPLSVTTLLMRQSDCPLATVEHNAASSLG